MAMQGKQLSAALRIPMRYMYMAIPVGCFVIDLHILDAIIQLPSKINGEVSRLANVTPSCLELFWHCLC
ncbi:hypothetical protein RBH76_00025 [Oscillospiraceae bacterium MB24-C1]|nr:hypothetical protein RBH76_00025 [Oscillospiraceae bacterium MB24-C1]